MLNQKVLSMAKSYVKFEVSPEVASKTYEAMQLAKQSGTIKKGANEVTKSVERGLASFVVIAADVEPEEVVVHLPTLCEQKKISYSYVPSKTDLGKAIGLNISCAAIAVENTGKAAPQIKDIVSRITGIAQKEQGESKAEKEKEQKEEKKPAEKAEKAKKEEKAEKVEKAEEKKAEEEVEEAAEEAAEEVAEEEAEEKAEEEAEKGTEGTADSAESTDAKE